MSKHSTLLSRGFTILEIILVLTAITLIVGIIMLSINPNAELDANGKITASALYIEANFIIQLTS